MPLPAGFQEYRIEPEGAFYDENLGEYLLPYELVRQAPDPPAMLMAFLQSTYAAAAENGKWEREELETELGLPRVPRRVYSV